MSPSEGSRAGRHRRWFRAVVIGCAFAALLTACATGSTPSPTAASAPATSHGREWLAVLGSAEDPNELDGPYVDLVGSLGKGSVTHVVVSPSACYSGLPSRYDGRYVLAVWDANERAVRALVDSAGAQEGWIGAVASTCVD